MGGVPQDREAALVMTSSLVENEESARRYLLLSSSSSFLFPGGDDGWMDGCGRLYHPRSLSLVGYDRTGGRLQNTQLPSWRSTYIREEKRKTEKQEQ